MDRAGSADAVRRAIPIIYPVALTKASTNADAQAFLNYLRSPAARTFERQGFTVLLPGGQRS